MLDDTQDLLAARARGRMVGATLPARVRFARYPVLVMLLWGSGSRDGSAVARAAMDRIGYWNLPAGHAVDLIFPGWSKHAEKVAFDPQRCDQFVRSLEAISRWRRASGTELILLDFEMPVESVGSTGWFAFDRVVGGAVAKLVERRVMLGIPQFIDELLFVSNQYRDYVGWHIFEGYAVPRGRHLMWAYIASKMTGGMLLPQTSQDTCVLCDLTLEATTSSTLPIAKS